MSPLLFRLIIIVYCQSSSKHASTLCGQNAEFKYVKAGDTYGDHLA
jgi:hypothetical protein